MRRISKLAGALVAALPFTGCFSIDVSRENRYADCIGHTVYLRDDSTVVRSRVWAGIQVPEILAGSTGSSDRREYVGTLLTGTPVEVRSIRRRYLPAFGRRGWKSEDYAVVRVGGQVLAPHNLTATVAVPDELPWGEAPRSRSEDEPDLRYLVDRRLP
jgi:hypothetical protein